MRKKKNIYAFSILASNKGESLAETLVAMLIISLSMAFLASSIAISVRMSKKATEEDLQNLKQWNHAERAICGEEENEIIDGTIMIEYPSDPVKDTYDGKVSNQDGLYTYWLKD